MIHRILIVGYGSIGKRHARIARELMPDAQIAVLRHNECNENPDSQIDFCFTDINNALDFQPQMAVIANPATYHIGVALHLAKNGVHLLVEKPLASSVEDVKNFLDMCSDKGIILMVGYNMRFLPSLQRFRELILKSIVGKVLSIRCEVGQNLLSWRPDVDYRQTVTAQSKLGGGVLLELSHEIDYLRWIFGDIEWIQAKLFKHSNLEIDVEDTAHLLFGFRKNEHGQQVVGSLNMDFIRHDSVRLCTVIGENGSLRWNGITGVVDNFDPKAGHWKELFRHEQQRDDSYIAEWQHFLHCTKTKARPLVSGEDGLAVLNIIVKARQSSNPGQII